MPANSEVSKIPVKKIKCGRTERISFSKAQEPVEIPYLIDIQKETYKQMLHEIIDSMDNADNLLYLIIFIEEKFKAG